MNQREAFLDTLALAFNRGMYTRPAASKDLSFQHLAHMWDEIQENPAFSDTKLSHWLGWAQAAVVASGVATIEDMKQINLKHADFVPTAWITEQDHTDCVHCEEAVELAIRDAKRYGLARWFQWTVMEPRPKNGITVPVPHVGRAQRA